LRIFEFGVQCAARFAYSPYGDETEQATQLGSSEFFHRGNQGDLSDWTAVWGTGDKRATTIAIAAPINASENRNAALSTGFKLGFVLEITITITTEAAASLLLAENPVT
jgi:hypothetical protein